MKFLGICELLGESLGSPFNLPFICSFQMQPGIELGL